MKCVNIFFPTSNKSILSGNSEGLIFIEQYASKVSYYTSQYGSINGVSYTANNLIGPPSRYPAYGDFPETYVPVLFY
jgi:F-box/leucine-rich repeat protein 4